MAASTSLTKRLGVALCDPDAAAELVTALNGAVAVGSISGALRRKLLSAFGGSAGEEVVHQLLNGSIGTPGKELNLKSDSALGQVLSKEFLTLLAAY